MNTKSNLFNFTTVTLVTACAIGGGLALANKPQPTFFEPDYTANVAPSEYSITQLNLTSDTAGEALIKLDGFHVRVGFDFEAHPDNYGVIGSDFTTVEIINLAIDKITDANGHEYNDFTNYNDHRNINQLIASYIESHHLVEAA